LLLSQYIAIGRETADVDFLMTQLDNEAEIIESAFMEILAVAINDSFEFVFNYSEILSQPHMKYPGYRLHIDVSFGKIKDKIHVDLGFGDHVEPVKNKYHPFQYRDKPIFDNEIILLMYPMETIFAEKLEAVISRGTMNSRMKDYHDLLLMVRNDNLLDKKKVIQDISTTFNARGTQIMLPIEFDGKGIEILQRLWRNHLRGLGFMKERLQIPDSFGELLFELNGWLLKIKVPRL
jgi:hypothetical protein